MTQTGLVHSREEPRSSLERVFLGWDRAALRSAAARLADRYADGSELRMSAATVVLPGARAGRRLKDLLLDEAESRGLRLVPPRITTLGSLPELLYRPVRPLASDTLCGWVWVRALRRLGGGRISQLVAAAPPESDLRGWARLAGTVAALHQEVAGAGLRFAGVVECCGEGLLFADTARWSALAEAQAHFEAELTRLGFADRGLARIDALATGTVSLDRELWLIGVVEMPGVLRGMLESLAGAGGPVRVLVHAPAEEGAGFDPVGCLRAEEWTARPLPLRDDQIAVRGRPGEQAEEVVRSLAALEGRYAASEIVIAAPNEELMPYVEQRLADAGVAVHTAAGTPVRRSSVARLLGAFADYLDGGRFDACAALARHPDLGRWLRRAGCTGPGAKALSREDGWLEAMDTYLTERLPARLDRGRVRAETGPASVVDALCAALEDPRLLGGLRGRRPLTAWMPEIMALLGEVYGEPALDRAHPSDRRLLDACAAVRDAAIGLFRLPEELDEECEGATAIRLLLDELDGAVLAPDPDADAVEMLGWLELRLDDAPVAVITGFNEPFLPESVNAHAFLPNALRERLGLVDNVRRYARDAYELTALLHSREEVRVIAGRRGAAGDPLRPSRLLFAVEGRPLAERVRRFFAVEASHPAAPPPEGEARAQGGRGFRMPVEPVIHAPEPIDRLRITAFRQLLADPYAFALEHVLELRPLDDTPRELDGMRFGNLAHEVLERFARSEDVHATAEKRVRQALEELLDSEVRARFGTHVLPAVRIQVEQLRARLQRLARWQAGWAAEGWRVMGVECSTPDPGVPFVVDGEPIHLTGRIDRIDYHPERREWVLFDYKTGDRGETPDDTHLAGRGGQRRWTDLQLPLYRHILPEVLDGERRPFAEGEPGAIRLGYVALPRDLERVGPMLAEWDEDDLRSADECACAVVRLLRENSFSFDPACARAYRNTPLAAVLGLGYLDSAAETEEDA